MSEISYTPAILAAFRILREAGTYDIKKALRSEHRTLQQSTIQQLITTLRDYSDAEHDARNEAAVAFCTWLENEIQNDNEVFSLAHLPLI